MILDNSDVTLLFAQVEDFDKISEHLFLRFVKDLVASEFAYLRRKVAQREDLPEEFFEQLARDEDEKVRAAMVSRENLPSTWLLNLQEMRANLFIWHSLKEKTC